MRVWQTTDGPVKEGKYLLVRRDGTIPPWKHFDIAEIDPCAPAAIEAYADKAKELGMDPEYVFSLRRLAADYTLAGQAHAARAAFREVKSSDPDSGPHRVDNPAIIALMRHEGDLTGYTGPAGPAPADPADEWALVEIMGHLSLAGRISEESRYGAQLLRVDVPIPDTPDFATQLFSGASIYRIRPCTEEVARASVRGDPRRSCR